MSHWVIIPETTRTRYISHIAALNLILPGELTGDWHFKVHFVDEEGMPRRTMPLAGEGSPHDTTPILGSRGVRDVTAIFARSRRGWNGPPVFAANHFRALADLACKLSHMDTLHRKDGVVMIIDNGSLNQWLNTPEDFETLRAEYLAPLASAIHRPETRRLFGRWFETVRYTP